MEFLKQRLEGNQFPAQVSSTSDKESDDFVPEEGEEEEESQGEEEELVDEMEEPEANVHIDLEDYLKKRSSL